MSDAGPSSFLDAPSIPPEVATSTRSPTILEKAIMSRYGFTSPSDPQVAAIAILINQAESANYGLPSSQLSERRVFVDEPYYDDFPDDDSTDYGLPPDPVMEEPGEIENRDLSAHPDDDEDVNESDELNFDVDFEIDLEDLGNVPRGVRRAQLAHKRRYTRGSRGVRL